MSIRLSCGCWWTEAMGPWEDLDFTYTDEVCTRDPDNPFVTAEISGSYCPECRKRIESQLPEQFP